jgi:hypothetical protein
MIDVLLQQQKEQQQEPQRQSEPSVNATTNIKNPINDVDDVFLGSMCTTEQNKD